MYPADSIVRCAHTATPSWGRHALAALLLLFLCAVPAGIGVRPAHAALPCPAPEVALVVPTEVLIGEAFTFQVQFNPPPLPPVPPPGTYDPGFGPFIDIVLPVGGIDHCSQGGSADGITFVSAQLIGINPGPIPLPAHPSVTAPCSSNAPPGSPCATQSVPHPHASLGVPNLSLPASSELVTIDLPFGSYDADEPMLTIEVTAKVSNLADLGQALAIYARGGYRFGAVATGGAPILGPAGCPGSPGFAFPSASALTTPVVMRVSKRYLGPESETATGPNFQRQYELLLDVADGQFFKSVRILDQLPANIVFTQPALITPAPGPVSYPPPGPASGSVLSVSWLNLTGTASPVDGKVVFSFHVGEFDAAGVPVLATATCGDTTSADSAFAQGLWLPKDPRDGTTYQAVQSATVGHNLIDKHLAVQKSVTVGPAPGHASSPVPGDTLHYKIEFQVSDYFTMGGIQVADFLSDGQKLASSPTLMVKDRFGTSTATFAVGTHLSETPSPAGCCPIIHPSPGQLCAIQGGRDLAFDVSAALAGSTTHPRHAAGILTGGYAPAANHGIGAIGIIEYDAVIQDGFAYPHGGDSVVSEQDPLRNCVVITAEMFQNVAAPAMPSRTGVPCTDDSLVDSRIAGGKLGKAIVAVNGVASGPNPLVGAGDLITFAITRDLVAGDTEHLEITDWMPLPVLSVAGLTYVPGLATSYPALNQVQFGPLHDPALAGLSMTLGTNPVDNSFTLAFPTTLSSLQNALQHVEILVTVQVSSSPFVDGLLLTNLVRECHLNTFGTQFCQTAMAQFTLGEPSLAIRKGVVWTDHASAVTYAPTAVSPVPFTGMIGNAPAPCPRFPGIPIINSSNLGALIDSDVASGLDANDTVLFAIVIENRGSGPYGAFDVECRDQLPPELAPVLGTVCITDGTGASLQLDTNVVPDDLFTTGIRLLDAPPMGALKPFHATTGQNLVVVSFLATVIGDVGPGCFRNRAQLLHYAASDGGPDFVGVNLVGPTGVGGPAFDEAKLCVTLDAHKCVTTTSEAHTSPQTGGGATPPVVIGEIVRYRVWSRLPEGVSVALQLRDALPPGLIYQNDGTTTFAFVSNGAPISVLTPPPPAVPLPPAQLKGNAVSCGSPKQKPTVVLPPARISGGPFGSGTDPVFSFGTVTNSDNDLDDEWLVVEFNALVANVASNQQGTILSNQCEVRAGPKGHVATSMSPPCDVLVVEPTLSIVKTVTPASVVAGPGVTVTYTVVVTNTGPVPAFDLVVRDTLPAAIPANGALTIQPSVAGSGQIGLNGSFIQVTIPVLAPGAQVLITYGAKVLVTCPQPVNPSIHMNLARLTWTSLPGANGTCPNPTGTCTPGAPGSATGERDGSTAPGTLNDYVQTAQRELTVQCLPPPPSSCVAPPALSNMVAWYPLDEGNGAPQAQDLRSTTPGRYFVPSAPWAAVQKGTVGVGTAPGMVLNGTQFGAPNGGPSATWGYVEVPATNANLNLGTSPFTLDAWVRLTVVVPGLSAVRPIVDKYDPASNKGFVFFLQGSTLKLAINGASFTGPNLPAVPPNTPDPWVHVAVSAKPNGLVKFYLNGQSSPPVAPWTGASATSVTNGVPLWIGGSRALGAPMTDAGLQIDEVEIFNVELPQADIQLIASALAGGKCKAGVAPLAPLPPTPPLPPSSEPAAPAEGTRLCVHVFEDLNGDGAQQLPDERGLGGWTVRVVGSRTGMLRTEENGVACGEVPPGPYAVVAQVPAGWTPTSKGVARTTVSEGARSDVYLGFRRPGGSLPGPRDPLPPPTPGPVPGPTPGPGPKRPDRPGEPPAPAPAPTPVPAGRMGQIKMPDTLLRTGHVTLIRFETEAGVFDLAVDGPIPGDRKGRRTFGVTSVRFARQARIAGAPLTLTLVMSDGEAVALSAPVLSLHLRMETAGQPPYDYLWEGGRSRGGPEPVEVTFTAGR